MRSKFGREGEFRFQNDKKGWKRGEMIAFSNSQFLECIEKVDPQRCGLPQIGD
jgi:hypothetical protein